MIRKVFCVIVREKREWRNSGVTLGRGKGNKKGLFQAIEKEFYFGGECGNFPFVIKVSLIFF